MPLGAKRSTWEKWVRRFSLRNKLLILIAAGIVPIICVALAGFYAIARLNQEAGVILATSASLRSHRQDGLLIGQVRGDVLGLMLAKTEQEKDRGRANFGLRCQAASRCNSAESFRAGARFRYPGGP